MNINKLMIYKIKQLIKYWTIHYNKLVMKTFINILLNNIIVKIS